jgi:hypothetical protein
VVSRGQRGGSPTVVNLRMDKTNFKQQDGRVGGCCFLAQDRDQLLKVFAVRMGGRLLAPE